MTFSNNRFFAAAVCLLSASSAFAANNAGPGGGGGSDSGPGGGGSGGSGGYTEESIRRVPVEYLTIQAAIDAANQGDQILVSGLGAYQGSGDSVINTKGKALWIKAFTDEFSGPVTIDGEGVRRCVVCDSGEGSNTIIEGFRIANGHGTFGGGAYCENSNPVFKNCTFKNNWASSGAGMFNRYSSPTLTNCSFSDNSAQYEGGGMSNIYSYPVLVDCNFTNNTGVDPMFGSGAGMLNFEASPVLIRGSFTGNQALGTSGEGGGMANYSSQFGEDGSDPVLTDCTFTDNYSGGIAGAIYSREAEDGFYGEEGEYPYSHAASVPVLSGTTICGNSLEQIEGDWIDDGGNTISNVCGVSDLPEDVNTDGAVDGADLAAVLGAWGSENSAADIDQDGTVNGADLALLLGAWN